MVHKLIRSQVPVPAGSCEGRTSGISSAAGVSVERFCRQDGFLTRIDVNPAQSTRYWAGRQGDRSSRRLLDMVVIQQATEFRLAPDFRSPGRFPGIRERHRNQIALPGSS